MTNRCVGVLLCPVVSKWSGSSNGSSRPHGVTIAAGVPALLGVLNAAAAESVEMDLCLQNLEEYVFEEQKLVRRLGWILVEANLLQSVSGFFDRQVTYRWLSAELKVPANTAKK